MKSGNMIKMVGTSSSKFYHWCDHYGEVRLKERPFNGWWGITSEEERAIVSNRRRLHSSIYYLAPMDVLEGRMAIRLKGREEKLRRAKEIRKPKVLENNLRK